MQEGCHEFEAGLVTYQVPGQPGFQSNILSQNKQQEAHRRLSFCVGTDMRQTWKYTLTLTTTSYPKTSGGPLTQADANGGGAGAGGLGLSGVQDGPFFTPSPEQSILNISANFR